MPITSKQRGLFGAELARRRRGKRPRLDIGTDQLRHMLRSSTRGSPPFTDEEIRKGFRKIDL